MKELEQKVAYLQGLSKGLALKESKEGEVIEEILDLLADMIEHMGFLHEEQQDLADYLESIDSDLADLEDDFYDDEDDEDIVEVECPNCHETVGFDADILYAEELIEVTCPVCDAVVFVNGDEEDFEDMEEAEEDEK